MLKNFCVIFGSRELIEVSGGLCIWDYSKIANNGDLKHEN